MASNSKKVNFQISKDVDLSAMRPKGFHRSINKEMNAINKRIEKNSGWEKVNCCPVCKSTKSNFYLTVYKNDIVECKKCSHIYTSKVPKKLEEVYENDIHFNATNAVNNPSRNYKISRFSVERVNIIKAFKKNGKLLDFGCGVGLFLEHAMKFYNSEGFEPTINLANALSKKISIPIHTSLKKLKTNYYDVVTAFDVIEHVKYPSHTFSEFNRVLKKGGILLIFTPNSDSISFKTMKDKQNLIIPPYHLHYFNKNSIEVLGKKKFDLIKYESAGLDIADIYAFERDAKNNGYAKFLKENMQVLQTFLDYNENSNHMRVIFKKK